VSIEALNCPNCGAPLPNSPPDGPWLCIYCSSLVRPIQPTPISVEAAALGDTAVQVESVKLDEAELSASNRCWLLVSVQLPLSATRSWLVSMLRQPGRRSIRWLPISPSKQL